MVDLASLRALLIVGRGRSLARCTAEQSLPKGVTRAPRPDNLGMGMTRRLFLALPVTRSAASPMFQLKLNDIELVSKPEYYRKYIIAIIGEP
jgi:hypothetical protein